MDPDASRDGTPVGDSLVFLFLQGVASPLFSRLADDLEQRGHRCLRVNFCPGDRLFWRRPGAVNYCGRYDEWPEFLKELIAVEGVTDLLLFSDVRPMHHLACRAASPLGVRVHVFEEGYLRPYCLSLDVGGANANSGVLKSVEKFLATAPSGGAVRQRIAPVPISMLNRAAWDIANHAANITMPWLHPHYTSHRPHHPLHELSGWSRRVLRRYALGERRRHRQVLKRFLASEKPFFLVPLQLDSDAQVVKHSDFDNVGEFLEIVFASFARSAPLETHLVVKCHPLDNDLEPRHRQVPRLADEHGIAERVLFVDGGHLPTLLGRARGLVTINSTVATSAFDHGCPVKALGRAIYNMPGLAAENSLDDFWHEPVAADHHTHRAFCDVLFDHCLVRGSFYSSQGIALALPALVRLLERRAAAHAKTRP